MTPEKLRNLFARCVEDVQFQIWNKEKLQEVRFVYACEFGVIWKFTPKAWWQRYASHPQPGFSRLSSI
jgi:hypothetical protein